MLGALAALLAATVLSAPTLPTGTDVDYQLGGAAPPAANVGIVVRDRTDAPAAGKFNVCYVNGFQTQPNEQGFWDRRPNLILRDADGDPVVDSAWGEFLLDVRTASKRAALAKIMDTWVAKCAADGYSAVEYDNLDSWTRSHRLMTKAQAESYAALLTAAAHAHGLAAGQKNTPQIRGKALGYDFAVSEECGRYDECQKYVSQYGDQVLMIEYRAGDFTTTCNAYGATHAVVLRDRNLKPNGIHRWC